MGNRATLLALSLIAAALAAVLAIDAGAPGQGRPTSRRLLGELVPSRVERLVWRRPGAQDVVLVATDGVWRMAEPLAAPVDDAAVTDVLGTLQLLSYRRRGHGQDLGDVWLRLEVDRVEVRVGARVEGVDRAWIGVGDGVFLVDGYAVRALDRTVDDLRSRVALDVPQDEITGVELSAGGHSMVLSGRPLGIHLDGVSGSVRVAPAHAAHILDAIAGLQLVRFVDGDAPEQEPVLVVRVIGGAPDQEVRVFGRCDGDDRSWLAMTPVGLGCLPDRQVSDLAAYPGTQVVDLVLWRGSRPARIRVGAVELERHGTAWRFADGAPADARAVDRWLEQVGALTATATVIRPPPEDALRVEIDGETLRVAPSERLAWRDGEGIALRLPSIDPLRAGALTFRPRAVFTEEPTGLRSAARTPPGERIVRGETHDDWGEGVDLQAVRAFRAAIATLRAERYVAGSLGGGVVALEVSFDPPPGQSDPVTHVLRIDRSCRATADGGPRFEVAPATCEVLRRPWR